MNLGENNKKNMERLSQDAGASIRLESKEARLMRLVKSMPITIKYGCHTIELKPDSYNANGYTFRAVEEDGKGLVIQIQ